MIRGFLFRDWKACRYVVGLVADVPSCKWPGIGACVLDDALASAPAIVDDFGDVVVVGAFV